MHAVGAAAVRHTAMQAKRSPETMSARGDILSPRAPSSAAAAESCATCPNVTHRLIIFGGRLYILGLAIVP